MVYRLHDKIASSLQKKKLYDWMEKATGNFPFKGMSEDEWLEACRYFGGCL